MIAEIFEQTCLNRYFELEAAEAIKAKLIKSPVYLSLGQEHIPAAISAHRKDWLIFAQHRCHSYYLSFGGDPELLTKELLGRKDGCNGGMGGSASCSWKNMFGHSGLLADQVPIAVGAAKASGKLTLAVVGDGGIEEDYALASLGYAVSWKLPILFVCEDNDLSILTKKSTRRSWNIVDVARGFGLYAVDVEDDPMLIYETFESFCGSTMPALVNINTCRHLWHAGAGNDGPPKYNRFEMFREKVINADVIEEKAKNTMKEIWDAAKRTD